MFLQLALQLAQVNVKDRKLFSRDCSIVLHQKERFASNFAIHVQIFQYFNYSTLQMFCLQNTQMFVWVLNSRTKTDYFYMYLFVINNQYFHVVFALNQTLNLQKNKHILSNLQNIFCCFNKLFHTNKIFSVFLLDMRLDFVFNRHLSVIITAFKNIQK